MIALAVNIEVIVVIVENNVDPLWRPLGKERIIIGGHCLSCQVKRFLITRVVIPAVKGEEVASVLVKVFRIRPVVAVIAGFVIVLGDDVLRIDRRTVHDRVGMPLVLTVTVAVFQRVLAAAVEELDRTAAVVSGIL